MSIVGPLVNPNALEDRFDRIGLAHRTMRHPVLSTLVVMAILAALAGAGIATHIIPAPF